jgi:hypothetical protein
MISISFLLALGKNTPIFPFLYRYVPSFDLFQAPTRFTIWAVLSFTLLVGIGIDQLKKPSGRALYWTRLSAAGCFAVLIGALLAGYIFNDIKLTFIRSAGLTGMLGLGFAALMLVKPESNFRKKHGLWDYALIGLVTLDLLLAGWHLNPRIDISFYRVEKQGETRSRTLLNEAAEYELKFNRFFVFDTFYPEDDWQLMHAYLLPNLNILHGTEMVNNYDPIVPGRYRTWMDELQHVNKSKESQLLDLMDVDLVISLDENGTPLKVNRNKNEPSRFFLIGCSIVVKSGDESLDLVYDEDVDLKKQLVIEGLELEPGSCNQVAGDIKVVDSSNQSIKLNIINEHDSWLLWSQSWYPGWKGRINGRPEKIYRANYLYQAVYIPEGNHEVEFIYQPLSFYLGAGISVVGCSAAISGLFLRKKAKQRLND